MPSRPIHLRCPTCLGRSRTQSGIPCTPCTATGWIIKPLNQLTPEQATELRRELQEIPRDADTAYQTESVRENLTKLLSASRFESVTFPVEDNTQILLHSQRTSIRIFPEFLSGKFIGLNAIPMIAEPIEPSLP